MCYFCKTNLNVLLFYFMFLASSCASEPCAIHNSVDISDGRFRNGKVLHDGLEYPSKYVFTKNVSGVIRTLGCLCEMKNCFRKCCPLGEVMHGKECTEIEGKDQISVQGLELNDLTTYRRTVRVEESGLGLVYGRPHCDVGIYMEDDLPLYVQEDGTLYLNVPNNERNTPFSIYHPDKFCIDTFIQDWDSGRKPELNALVCAVPENDKNHYVLSCTCMLISCFFIILTVGVYAWLPELRNLHGIILIAYLFCFFFGFISLTTMQILILKKGNTMIACTVLSFFIYFFMLGGFFWLNVMCYDIWYTFSGKRGQTSMTSVRSRFLKYSAYAFGMPTLLTVILAALEFSDLPHDVPMMPRLRRDACFLYKWAKLFYLYGPMTVLCVINFIFFILTSLKIAKIKKQTKQVLKSNESSTHDPHKKDKQRLSLYVKLFAVMGASWILEVVSSLFPQADNFWMITDAYNVLIGLIIFIIFVCKKKTLNMLKDRYRSLRGLPISRTPTTTSTSTRTLSSQSRDSIHMTSINKTENRS